jgi:hypothetical protein
LPREAFCGAKGGAVVFGCGGAVGICGAAKESRSFAALRMTIQKLMTAQKIETNPYFE